MNIPFIEHQKRPFQDIALTGMTLDSLPPPEQADKEKCLGLSCCDYRNGGTVQANYYIGLAWLKEGEYSISVAPKIKIDCLRMFMDCFCYDDEDVQDKLMQIYSIDFDKPCIRLEESFFEFTPFILIHFLQIVKRIIKRGLKKGYILHEENLSGKVKGKILFSKHFQRNMLMGKAHCAYCRYQEYSEDCIENRILKKALRFAEHFLKNQDVACGSELNTILKEALQGFGQVSDAVDVQQIKTFRINPLYKEYARALKVAKLILRRFSYDIQSACDDADALLPPFWIDMPLLYELYVLTLLRNRFGKDIYYHIATRKDEIDFGKRDESLIMDAKYVPAWEEHVKSEHIGQLARYARSPHIRRRLLGREDNTCICNCLLLYPNEDGLETFQQNEILREGRIEELDYLQFYKLGIKLPQRPIE